MAYDPHPGDGDALPHAFHRLNARDNTRRNWRFSFLAGITPEIILRPYIVVSYGDVRAAWDRRTVQRMGYTDTRRAAFGVFVCGTQGLIWAHHGYTHFQRIRLFARFEDSNEWLLLHDIGFESLVDEMVEIRVEYDESLEPVPLGDVGNPRINGWHVGGADNSTNDRDMMKFCLALMGGFMAFTLVVAAMAEKKPR